MSLKKLYVNICSPSTSACVDFVSDDESYHGTSDEVKKHEEDPLMVKPLPPRTRLPILPILTPIKNRSGRPNSASSLKFCPQPQSAVVASFCRERQNTKLNVGAKTEKSTEENIPCLQNETEPLPSPCNSLSSDIECEAKCNLVECCAKSKLFAVKIEETSKPDLFTKKGNFELQTETVHVPEKCNVKEETFVTNALNGEMKTEFTCNLSTCTFTGDNKQALKIHKKQKHCKSKDYVCDQCTYRTHAASDLRKHYRLHSGEQPYACPQQGCKYRGKHSNNLDYHTRKMHPTGEPLKCEYNDCDYMTRFSCALRIHSIKKHSGEKTVACELCPYRCYIRGDLRKHMISHSSATPHTCDFPGCGYACKLSSNLRKHRRSHTEERPYACEQCAFRSNFISSLKAHRRTHTDERPYCCDQCGYRCNSASNLKKHITQRHPGAIYTTKDKYLYNQCHASYDRGAQDETPTGVDTLSQPSQLVFRNVCQVKEINKSDS